MKFYCELDKKINDIFNVNIDSLDANKYHVDVSVGKEWHEEHEQDLPSVIFTLKKNMIYIIESEIIYFNSYDKALKFVYEEKQLLEKGGTYFPLFERELNSSISETVWTNGIKYEYRTVFRKGNLRLQAEGEVGDWEGFYNKVLEIRKKYKEGN